MKTTCQPIIGVHNVEKSSAWYQKLFQCDGLHGGPTFEMLGNENDIFMCLHAWEEHDHPTISDPSKPTGHGLILYFQVDNLEKVWNKALEMEVEIEKRPEVNENSGKKEFAIRDLDGYFLLISCK